MRGAPGHPYRQGGLVGHTHTNAQLALGVVAPHVEQVLKNALAIAAGKQHGAALVLTDTGERKAATWGMGLAGQLGTGSLTIGSMGSQKAVYVKNPNGVGSPPPAFISTILVT